MSQKYLSYATLLCEKGNSKYIQWAAVDSKFFCVPFCSKKLKLPVCMWWEWWEWVHVKKVSRMWSQSHWKYDQTVQRTAVLRFDLTPLENSRNAWNSIWDLTDYLEFSNCLKTGFFGLSRKVWHCADRNKMVPGNLLELSDKPICFFCVRLKCSPLFNKFLSVYIFSRFCPRVSQWVARVKSANGAVSRMHWAKENFILFLCSVKFICLQALKMNFRNNSCKHENGASRSHNQFCVL